MLNQLLETQAAPQRKPLGTAVSVILHGALAIGALRATGRDDAVALNKPVEVVVRQSEAPREKPIPVHQAPPAGPRPSTYFGHQVVVAPVTVPIDIPPVDLTAPATNPADFSGEGLPGGRAAGDPGGTPVTDVAGSAVYIDGDVEKVAATLPGSPAPHYPEILKSSGVEGEARVQFIVDTLGRAEPASFRVLDTTHEAFGAAVQAALPRMRFIPAEIGGRKVRMLVQQRFAFALDR